MNPAQPGTIIRAAPWLFVVIWASGFVAAKYAAPYAEPLTFLLLRYVGVIALMVLLAVVFSAPWPGRRTALHLAVAGIGIQAGYLGGVWVAIGNGMPAAVAALLVNLQPVLTAIAAPLVGERVSLRQGAGFLLGFAGVFLVVVHRLTAEGLTWAGIGLAGLALASITIGTLYQKRFVPSFDLRTGQIVQFAASVAVTVPFAVAFESFRLTWTGELVAALAWSVLVLTGCGVSLLYLMIRHDAATRVTSYLYLVPPTTALMAWALFGEALGLTTLAGMAVAVLGVALTAPPRDRPPRDGLPATP